MSNKSENDNSDKKPSPAATDAAKQKREGRGTEDYGFYFYPERQGRGDPTLWKTLTSGYNLPGKNLKCIGNVYKCAEFNPMVKLLMAAMKSHGCDFDITRHVSCEMCRSSVNGGFDPTTNQIVVCQNNTKSYGRCCGVLAHEMTHMFDYCRAKLDFTNLEHLACTEIRAACFNHCSFMSAFTQGDAGFTHFKKTHESCVKRKALMSILCTRDIPVEKGKAVVDKVFTRCYNDLEPFGRIPRRKSRDPIRMLAEGALYGYTDT